MKQSRALAAGGLGLVIVWWYWRVEAPISRPELSFFNYDLYSYYYPTIRFAFEELRRGHLPLWNPYQLAGEPFLANQQHGIFYPPNLLFLVLPAHLAFKWSAIVHYALAVLFAGYLGKTLGLSTGAAAVAALTFAFSGYLQSMLYLRTWLNGAVWLPLELAFAIRIFRAEHVSRMTLFLAVAFACQYVGGYPMHSLFAGYCLTFFAVWQTLSLARRGQWRTVVHGCAALAAAAAVAVSLCAVQLLPMIEMTWLSPRRLGSLHPLAANLVPHEGLVLLATLAYPATHNSAYIGAAVVPLVLCSVLDVRRRAMACFLIVLAVLAACLAASSATPLYALYRQLPTSNWFRFPHDFLYLVTVGLAAAAGIGAEAVATRTQRLPTLAMGILAVIALVVAFVIRLQPLSVPAWLVGVAVLLIAFAVPFLLIVGHSWRIIWLAVAVIIWLDLALAAGNWFIIPDVAPDRFEPSGTLTAFLGAHQEGQQRVYFHTPPLQAPVAKLGMRYHLFTVADHESLLPSRYADYAAWMQNAMPPPLIPAQGGVFLEPRRKQMKLLDLLGVRYIVASGQGPFVDSAEAAAYPMVLALDDTRVYENPHALPRAFVAGHAEQVAPREILRRLASPTFDPLQTALVETGAAVLSGGSSRAAAIRDYQPERVVVETGDDTPGLLVLTDQFYPGWHATVDGQAVPIYCVDYIFRGVRLAAGPHTVIFTYRPMAFIVGLWISVVTLAGLVIWAAWEWRRARAAEPVVAQTALTPRGSAQALA